MAEKSDKLTPKHNSDLTPTQIKKLSKTLDELKGVIPLQEEILAKVLKSEQDIANFKLASLNQYFDTYSKSLDAIARKQSQLTDAFLLLNEKYNAFNDRLEKSSESNWSFTVNQGSGSSEQSDKEKPTEAIEKKNISEADKTNKSSTEPSLEEISDKKKSKDKEVSNEEMPEGFSAVDLSGPTEAAVEAATRKREAAEDFLYNVQQFNMLSLEEQRKRLFKSRLDEEGKATKEDEARAARFEEYRLSMQIKNAEKLANKQQELENTLFALNNLRYQTEEDRQARLLSRQLDAELEAANLDLEVANALADFETENDFYSQQHFTEKVNASSNEPTSGSVQPDQAATAQEAAKPELLQKENSPSKEDTVKEAAKQQGQPKSQVIDLHVNGAGSAAQRIAQRKAEQKVIQKMEEDRAAYIAKRELDFKRKNNGVLTAEAATIAREEAARKFKLDQETLKKLAKEQQEADTRAAAKKQAQESMAGLNKGSIQDRIQSFKDLTQNEDGEFDKDKIKAAAGVALESAVNAISDLAKQLEDKIADISSHKSSIDTRLQGSTINKRRLGSYWDQMINDMTSIASMSIYYKQKDFTANIETLVEKGISFDLKQRAFLMTIHDKIARTFDAADGTLLRLIRIQQADTTAGRLGMETALNTFLNQMYETSEYLSDVAKQVRSSLEEMQSLMDGREAVEVEYQVQKWLGSMYSVGMSSTSVTNISTALGQIAAGQVEGLNNGAGNLIIMAANDAGLSIADLLTDGIDANDTNKLLQAVVKYLAELAESAKDNKIVQQQLADVFGVKASDLKAATNLTVKNTVDQIFSNDKYNSYSQMVSQLYTMAGSMYQRTSVGEIMDNMWENGQYTLAGGIAKSPVSYLIYRLADVVDKAAGGIDLPFVNVMGFGVDLNTTVSDLMRIASVGTGLLGSLGPMISGLSSSFSGREMLRKAGISEDSGYTVLHRGGLNSANAAAAGTSVSQSGLNTTGNASGSDIKNSTIQEANDSKKQQMVEAKEEEEENKVDFLNMTVLKIYELLDDVAHGNANFRVKIDGYGLVTGGRQAAAAQGGVDGLISNSGLAGNNLGNNYYGGSSFNSNVGNIGGSGVKNGIDFGNWITNA